MRIETDDQKVQWERVVDLFRAVGWRERDAEEVRRAFARSSFKAFAFEDGELVGFGRTVDDGRFYASIVDVVVAPNQQGRGVGRAIVEKLQRLLDGYSMVTLTASLEVQGFYRRLGWQSQTTAMMLPRSEEQRRLNCAETTESR
jgi:ribosomal protein S18 acetylase RimI-like enzyme